MAEDRETVIARFLAAGPAAGARRRKLAGDASLRRYERLELAGGGSVVLMDADPSRGEDVRPFEVIARWLREAGFSAPSILAEDAGAGLLLLEDLGDDLFFDVIARDRKIEEALYSRAVDLLAALRRVPAPAGLSVYDATAMTDRAALAHRWYAGLPPDAEAAFRHTFAQVIARHAGPPDTVALRDYHAQNLFWLPDREGLAQVGLIDFQDAMLAPAVYDLVSLLHEARRDVPTDLAMRMIARFIATTESGDVATRRAFSVVAVQRNLRILGTFARLSLHFGKPGYIDLLPRVWGHLTTDLADPALDPVRGMLLEALPEPTPSHLQDLKDRCGTIPTP